jgi:hypothetical protein
MTFLPWAGGEPSAGRRLSRGGRLQAVLQGLQFGQGLVGVEFVEEAADL